MPAVVPRCDEDWLLPLAPKASFEPDVEDAPELSVELLGV